MTMMQTPKQEDVPNCFGKDWDSREPECAGGLDARYTDPATGRHVRAKCEFFETCGARMQAVRQIRAQVPIAPTQLVRPPQTPSPVQNVLGQAVRQLAPYLPPPQQSIQVRPTAPPTIPQPQPPPAQYVHPQGAAPVYQLNYMLPGYLSAPETRQPGESFWKPLAFEVLRALGKSAGHTIAHFFDHNTVRWSPPRQ